MKGFWILFRDGVNRVWKNGKSYPRYFSSTKPMTGKELEILEEYYKALGESEKKINHETENR